MYLFNAQLNRHPSWATANYSPNQVFFVKKNDKFSVYNEWGKELVKVKCLDAGLDGVYKMM